MRTENVYSQNQVTETNSTHYCPALITVRDLDWVVNSSLRVSTKFKVQRIRTIRVNFTSPIDPVSADRRDL